VTPEPKLKLQWQKTTRADDELLSQIEHSHTPQVAGFSEEQLAQALAGEHTGVLFYLNGQAAGFALWHAEADGLFLEYLMFRPEHLHKRLGTQAYAILRRHYWMPKTPVRVEVAEANRRGRRFFQKMARSDPRLKVGGPRARTAEDGAKPIP
jgi:hypothetical protein